MKKVMFLVFVLILIVFISGCSTKIEDQINDQQGNLPDSFKIKIWSDSTSAAASRYYNADLTFENNKLVYGVQKYGSDDTLGNQIRQEYVFDVSTSSWVNVTREGGGNLTYVDLNLISKEYIQEKIGSGYYKIKGECIIFDICYEII